MFKHIKIRSYEIGLLFRDREFKRLLEPGSYWLFDIGWLLPWRGRLKADIVSKRDPWLVHEKLDLIVRSGVLKDRAIVLDLKDYERALVWIDGRFSHVLPPRLYAYWTGLRDVRTEVVDLSRAADEASAAGAQQRALRAPGPARDRP